MLPPLLSRSPDLRRLLDEGYEVQISKFNYLLITGVPYINARREVVRGTLASTLDLAGDVTARPTTHVALFVGEPPCEQDGKEIVGIGRSPLNQPIAPGLVAQFQFSSK